uniref:Uncharacterized protein n=1 Tax=Cacopsylla melanoneura TaxID=428564 RepID=A0A8D8VZ74_9HEMI
MGIERIVSEIGRDESPDCVELLLMHFLSVARIQRLLMYGLSVARIQRRVNRRPGRGAPLKQLTENVYLAHHLRRHTNGLGQLTLGSESVFFLSSISGEIVSLRQISGKVVRIISDEIVQSFCNFGHFLEKFFLLFLPFIFKW